MQPTPPHHHHHRTLPKASPHPATHAPLLFCRLPSVQTLRVEAAPGRFELLALTKLRTPPGLRGKHGEQQPTDADAMPPPPSPSASAAAAHGRGGHAAAKAGAQPPPSRSQLHRVRLATRTLNPNPNPNPNRNPNPNPNPNPNQVRLAWTDGAGVPRVLGPLPAFYLGAALASSVKRVPGCSLARTDSERPCVCAWSTGKRGSPCVCESRMARTALISPGP